MKPTREASERQRKAAVKAWKTIRLRKAARSAEKASEGADVAKGKKTIPKARKTNAAKQDKVSWKEAYPKNWNEIVVDIRARARNADGLEQCECGGECLKHLGRCEEINQTWAMHRRRKGKVKIRLTTAHLCHTPKCDNKSHMRAMCEPCHLIYDLRCRQLGLRGSHAIMWAAQQRSRKRFTVNS